LHVLEFVCKNSAFKLIEMRSGRISRMSMKDANWKGNDLVFDAVLSQNYTK